MAKVLVTIVRVSSVLAAVEQRPGSPTITIVCRSSSFDHENFTSDGRYYDGNDNYAVIFPRTPFCSYVVFQTKKWYCSGCKSKCAVPDGAASDGGDTGGGAGGTGVARGARTRASRSWHTGLIQTSDPVDEATVAENYQEATEGKEKNKENYPFMEDRNLTLKLVVEAVRAMKQVDAVNEKLCECSRKDDCRLYGITVRDLNHRDDGTTVDETVVTLDGQKGIVISERRDGEG